MAETASQISAEAATLAASHKLVGNTYFRRSESRVANQAWHDACEEFHHLVEGFHRFFRPDYISSVVSVDGGDRETAIAFLEANPWCFRSGYIKEKLVRALKRADLTERQCQRLRYVLLAVLSTKTGCEFRAYCRLAYKVADDCFRNRVAAIINGGDQLASTKAKWMLDYLDSDDRPQAANRVGGRS